LIQLESEISRSSEQIARRAPPIALQLNDANDPDIVEYVEIVVDDPVTSAVLITGNVRVTTDNAMQGTGTAGSVSARYNIELQKADNPGFDGAKTLVVTSGLAFLEVVTTTGAQRINVPGGVSFNYIDTEFGLSGEHVFYRLLFVTQTDPDIMTGNFLVIDRTMNVLQLRR